MDIKVTGITSEIMREALEQARQGRLHILGKMQATLQAPRNDISPYAPRIVTIQIPVDKIRDVIGPGGKMIRSIIEKTGVKIDVEDDGRVNVASADEESAQRAIAIIQELTATPELNKTYLGKVQRITDFGAFVEIMPGVDGLLHVSEIAHHRVKDVRDELKEGEQLMVKVINIDPSGKIRLSRKALLEGADEAAPAGGEAQPSHAGGGGTTGAIAADMDRVVAATSASTSCAESRPKGRRAWLPLHNAGGPKPLSGDGRVTIAGARVPRPSAGQPRPKTKGATWNGFLVSSAPRRWRSF